MINVNNLNLPAGTYWVIATARGFNNDDDPQTMACRLEPSGQQEDVRFDGRDDGGATTQQVSVVGPVTTPGGLVSLFCQGFQILLDRVTLTAFPLGSLVVQ